MSGLIMPVDYGDVAEVNKKDYDHTISVPPFVVSQKSLAGTPAKPKSEPVQASCHTTYKAIHNSGQRPLNQINKVVMHCTQSPANTAESVARFFTSAASGGSAHLVVDDLTCYRCLNDSDIPWGAPGANYNGFHIEQCGYVTWTKVIWSKTHRKQLQRAAYKAAYHCKKYGIPVKFVDAAGLKAGKHGITTHIECTKAYGPTGGHTDPGPNWPKALFMTMTKAYALKIKRFDKKKK